MEFISALQWGTGLSLGFCVGLVTWAIVRTKFFASRDDTYLDVHRDSVDLLRERNRLTAEETNVFLERIAHALEVGHEC